MPIAVSLGLMLALLGAVRMLPERLQLSAETRRKLVHVGLGLYCLSFPWIFDAPWQVAVLAGLAILVLLVLRLPRLAADGLGQALHAVGRRSYGELLFALAIAIVFFRGYGVPILYVLPVAILTLCDAAAALVGSTYGRRVFTVESGQKSWEGVAFFFLTAWLLAMVALLLTDVPRINVILLGLFVAAFGAQVEADSWRGLDNLFVPVALQAVLVDALPGDAMHILELLAMLAGTLAITIVAARLFDFGRHEARVGGLLIFTVWTIAGLEDVILPGLALAAFVLSERLRPSEAGFPYLNGLLAIIAVGLFWLIVGEGAGFTAIDVYNLSFAAAAVVPLAVFFGRRPLAMAGACLLALAVQQAQAWLLGPAEPTVAFAAVSAAAIAAAGVVAMLVHDRLDRRRATKVFGIGLVAGLASLPVVLP